MGRRNEHVNSKKENGTVLVSGSLVIDTLFEGASSIRDQIVVEGGKPALQNLMFAVSKREVFFGGSAGNISYGLSLLGTAPLVVSVMGKDSGAYQKHLKELGVESRVFIDTDGYTPSFFGMTDTHGEQIGIFEPGCYHKHVQYTPLTSYLKQSDWKKISIAIFSPGTAKSIARGAQEVKKISSDILVIVDPGQMLAIDFTKELLTKAIHNADVLIMNETEAHFMKTKLGITHEMLWQWKLPHFIVTKGKYGSTLYTKEKTLHVPAQVSKRAIDPTGAGDAFRAGLIHSLLAGKTIIEGMKQGSRLGAKCVEKKGGQTYKI